MSIEGRNTKKWPTRTAKLPKCGAGPHLLPSGAVVNWLGPSRLHLHHGPIDLIVGVDGQKDDVCSAYTNAVNAFDGLLNTLVEELPLLREPYLRSENCSSAFRGPVAKRMAGACEPFIRGYKSSDFITLMIAVAGSVADYVLDEMGHRYCRAYVNNGGDIAIRVPSGSKYDIGIIDEKDVFLQDSTFPEGEERSKKIPMKGRISISHNDLVGGIATSGWRGRSLSTGIADTVTVLAKNAARADVAATLVANAVKVESKAVVKVPACEIDDFSDLGERLVTVDVGTLAEDEINFALQKGAALARFFYNKGWVTSVYGQLQGKGFVVG